MGELADDPSLDSTDNFFEDYPPEFCNPDLLTYQNIFVEKITDFAENYGIPRKNGRIFGYFVFYQKLTQEDLQERTGFSQSKVSKVLKNLLKHAIIERKILPNTHTNLYRLKNPKIRYVYHQEVGNAELLKIYEFIKDQLVYLESLQTALNQGVNDIDPDLKAQFIQGGFHLYRKLKELEFGVSGPSKLKELKQKRQQKLKIKKEETPKENQDPSLSQKQDSGQILEVWEYFTQLLKRNYEAFLKWKTQFPELKWIPTTFHPIIRNMEKEFIEMLAKTEFFLYDKPTPNIIFGYFLTREELTQFSLEELTEFSRATISLNLNNKINQENSIEFVGVKDGLNVYRLCNYMFQIYNFWKYTSEMHIQFAQEAEKIAQELREQETQIGHLSGYERCLEIFEELARRKEDIEQKIARDDRNAYKIKSTSDSIRRKLSH